MYRQKEDEICPYSIEEPLAPRLAMKRAGRVVKLKDIMRHYEELLKEFNSVFVEGAGGLAVPYTEDSLVIDFAKQLQLPLIIVARSYARDSKSYCLNNFLCTGTRFNSSRCNFV